MCKVAIYEALPLAFDSIFEAACHVVVVSQLVNCIKEQVLNKLPNLGILAASLLNGCTSKEAMKGRIS